MPAGDREELIDHRVGDPAVGRVEARPDEGLEETDGDGASITFALLKNGSFLSVKRRFIMSRLLPA